MILRESLASTERLISETISRAEDLRALVLLPDLEQRTRQRPRNPGDGATQQRPQTAQQHECCRHEESPDGIREPQARGGCSQ